MLFLLGFLGLTSCTHNGPAAVVCNTPDGAVLQVEATDWLADPRGNLLVSLENGKRFIYHMSHCIVIPMVK